MLGGGHQSHSPRCRRYGAYLLRDTARVTRIVRTLASGLKAKIRLLPDRRESIDLALAIEDSGAAALCVHGRTVDQRPPLGGDETGWRDALRCLSETSCAAVMSAEALLEKPDLFEAPGSPKRYYVEEPSKVEVNEAEIPRMLRLSREFLDLAERNPSPLKRRGRSEAVGRRGQTGGQ
eukprot:Skav230650  [mRNA]  locus=scaffold2103:133027:136895:- [translate_table: standard]